MQIKIFTMKKELFAVFGSVEEALHHIFDYGQPREDLLVQRPDGSFVSPLNL